MLAEIEMLFVRHSLNGLVIFGNWLVETVYSSRAFSTVVFEVPSEFKQKSLENKTTTFNLNIKKEKKSEK